MSTIAVKFLGRLRFPTHTHSLPPFFLFCLFQCVHLCREVKYWCHVTSWLVWATEPLTHHLARLVGQRIPGPACPIVRHLPLTTRSAFTRVARDLTWHHPVCAGETSLIEPSPHPFLITSSLWLIVFLPHLVMKDGFSGIVTWCMLVTCAIWIQLSGTTSQPMPCHCSVAGTLAGNISQSLQAVHWNRLHNMHAGQAFRHWLHNPPALFLLKKKIVTYSNLHSLFPLPSHCLSLSLKAEFYVAQVVPEFTL